MAEGFVCSAGLIAVLIYLLSGLFNAIYLGIKGSKGSSYMSVMHGVICCMLPVLNTALTVYIIGKWVFFVIAAIVCEVIFGWDAFWESVKDNIIDF